jgi:hypothetical protein
MSRKLSGLEGCVGPQAQVAQQTEDVEQSLEVKTKLSITTKTQTMVQEGPRELPKAERLKVCVLTADFWGLKTAGGTATAYHLLASTLAKSKALDVSLPTFHDPCSFVHWWLCQKSLGDYIMTVHVNFITKSRIRCVLVSWYHSVSCSVLYRSITCSAIVSLVGCAPALVSK